ncbi:hypothetical protein BGZ49_003930, partial [Haplosporangium sp. Z 27]
MTNQSTDITTTGNGIPKFGSTLVIAIPDVLEAGPKILLSSNSASANGQPIPEWSHFFKRPSASTKKSFNSNNNNSSSSNSKSDSSQTIIYSGTTTDDAKGLPALPKDVPLGDHILNSFLTHLAFIDIPTVALVHPAKKGISLREAQAIFESLTDSLISVVGDKYSSEFLADKAFNYNLLKSEDEESLESMMYL